MKRKLVDTGQIQIDAQFVIMELKVLNMSFGYALKQDRQSESENSTVLWTVVTGKWMYDVWIMCLVRYGCKGVGEPVTVGLRQCPLAIRQAAVALRVGHSKLSL
ncbi:hypothetical protein V6N11_077885 [Hibiscus sabdariffa]|uniref:Uncharacterized protein n=1 Tax=Hibiscus sabdariffa TaxID=183260 RepID=A0ABR2TEE6_9ROSI